MSKHTPGPWEYRAGRFDWGDTRVEGVGGTVRATSGARWNIAAIHDNLGGGEETALANARLIAAAPLLKDTNYALAVLALQSGRYVSDPEYRDAVDAALNANAIAEGA